MPGLGPDSRGGRPGAGQGHGERPLLEEGRAAGKDGDELTCVVL